MAEIDPNELIRATNYLGTPTALTLQGEKATPTGGASLPAPSAGPGGTSASGGGIMGAAGTGTGPSGGGGFPIGAIQKLLGELFGGGGLSAPGSPGGDPESAFAKYRAGEREDLSGLIFPAGLTGEVGGAAQGLGSAEMALGTGDLGSLGLESYLRYLQGLEGLEGSALGSAGTALSEAGGGADLLGSLGTGVGAAGSGLGALTGLLGLYGGAQTGNPLQAGQGALSTYNSLASLLSTLGYDTLPSLGSLGTNALSALAPELGSVLSGVAPAAGGGIGGIGGASLGSLGSGAVVGGEALAGAGAAGAGAGSAVAPAAGGVGAGLTGAGLVASAYALPVMIGIMAAMSNLVEAPEKKLAQNIKDTGQRREALGENIGTIGNRIGEQEGLDYGSMTPEQLQQRWQDLQGALAAEANVNWMNQPGGGSTAPSKIPRLDPTMIGNVQTAYHERLVPEMAALQDAMAAQGVPLSQFFDPTGATDILQLAGRGTTAPNAIDLATLTPEQLAGIGPGNMLQALQAIRTGGSLTGLNQPVAGVQEARLAQLQKAAAQPGGMGGYESGQYVLDPGTRAAIQAAQEQQRFASSYGTPEFGGGYAPADPGQIWSSFLSGRQPLTAPSSMFAPAPGAPGSMQNIQQMVNQLGPGALAAAQGGAAEAGGGPTVNPLNEEYIRRLLAQAGIKNPAALAAG